MISDILKQIWPEWKIEEKPIGEGAFGVVYKAVRKDYVESYAAIKVISIPSKPSEIQSLRSEGLSMNETKKYFQTIVNDFVSEIQLMESLKGVQNIVSVEDYKVIEKKNEIGWDIYIRMELLTPFNTYIKNKKITEKEVIKLGCDICTALEICSKRNIIHRDIKPENIFINDFGDFKLGDFGIARKLENMTNALSQKGTLEYIAPEVATKTEYDARVDIYSLGIVLYRLLNNNLLPFLDSEKQLSNPNARAKAVERRIGGENLPKPCNASPAMANLILRACAFEPKLRFASATEMKQALISVEKGTYQMKNVNILDGTTAVRKSSAVDKTTSVRKATNVSNQKENQKVPTFGDVPKKNKIPKVIVVFGIVVLMGIGVFVAPKLKDSEKENTKNSEVAEYSKFDEEEIEKIISEADALATDGDYEAALTKIQTGLVTYPKSKALQEKSEEYTSSLNKKVKETTLAEAKALSETGDYVGAMALIKNAQETYGEDAEYQNAYDTYNQAHISKVKTDAIAAADGLAEQKDYIGAVKKIKEAMQTIGSDAELKAKTEEYEDSYVTEKVNEVQGYLEANDLESAESTIATAVEAFPNNQKLLAQKEIVKKSMPKLLLVVCPPYKTNDECELWTNVSMGGVKYAKGVSVGGDFWCIEGFALFNLAGKYNTLSFDVGSRDDKKYTKGQMLYIYLDDNLAWSLELDPDALPTNYTVDVSGANQMKIVGSEQAGRFGIADILITEKVENN